MKKLFTLMVVICCCAIAAAQNFRGYVKKDDSTSAAIFQAKVEVKESAKALAPIKTYFDGSFKFPLKKLQQYVVKISYPGYTDTAYSFTADKLAKPSAQEVTVKLKKDGMRLMGIINSMEENFPIKDATIILKNVMTRKEERITTGIDGKYNFKLEYETNYKVWIDKRSPGIFNKYKDTAFYVSTVGFNQPLDYKLDLALGSSTGVQHQDNSAIRQSLKNAKTRVIKVDSTLNATLMSKDTINIPEKEKVSAPATQTAPSAKKDTVFISKKPEKEIAKASEASIQDTKESAKPIKEFKSKNKEKLMEVVVIRDTVRPKEEEKPIDLLEQTRQRAIAEQKAREEEKRQADLLARQKAEEEQKRKQQIVAEEQEKKLKEQQALEERIKKEQQQRELAEAAEVLAKRLKFMEDSLAKVKEAAKIRAQAKAASVDSAKPRQNVRPSRDSIVHQKPKAIADSSSRVRVTTVAPVKVVADSAKRAKDEVKPAIVAPLRKDSSSTNKPSSAVPKPNPNLSQRVYLTKTQEELIAAAEAFARRKKFLADSVARVKEEERKRTEGLEKK